MIPTVVAADYISTGRAYAAGRHRGLTGGAPGRILDPTILVDGTDLAAMQAAVVVMRTRRKGLKMKTPGRSSQGLLGVLEQYGTLGEPRFVDGEAMYPSGSEPPFEVVQCRESSWRVLLLNDALLRWHSERLEGLPATLITSFFPVCHAVADELGGHVDATDRTIAIVGDLDPHALCQFCAFTRCNPVGVQVFSGARWLGVDDTWISLLQRYSLDWKVAVIEMTDVERALFRDLERVVEVDAIVGSGAAALLREGRKLELEGASNPALYAEGFAAALLQHLRDRLEASSC